MASEGGVGVEARCFTLMEHVLLESIVPLIYTYPLSFALTLSPGLFNLLKFALPPANTYTQTPIDLFTVRLGVSVVMETL